MRRSLFSIPRANRKGLGSRSTRHGKTVTTCLYYIIIIRKIRVLIEIITTDLK